MIQISNKSLCCGCTACEERCPKHCITMQEDEEGFLYPKVDTNVCTNCGLCEKVCPMLNPFDKHVPLQTLSAFNTNEEIRLQSSSGGIFTLLAENVIEKGGVVFGTRFDEQWQAVVGYTNTKEGLAPFRGSKYLQSKKGTSFQQIRRILLEGRKVLFSGTPCEVSGLKHFLQKDYENLLLVDVVCHGVPGPKVWKKYLTEIVGEFSNVKNCSMRGKKEGWKRFNFTLDYNEEGNVLSLSQWFGENDYMQAFLKDMILRPSCYACKMRDCRSHSDITLADFWGIENVSPEMDDDKGCSLVMLHTEKGKNIFSQLPAIRCKDATFEEACRYNPAIWRNPKEWFRRKDFFAHLEEEESVVNLIREMLQPTLWMRMKKGVYFCIAIPKHIASKVLKLLKVKLENRGGAKC